MYGAVTGSGGLAVTGLAVGSWALMGIGLVFLGVALVALLRPRSNDRP